MATFNSVAQDALCRQMKLSRYSSRNELIEGAKATDLLERWQVSRVRDGTLADLTSVLLASVWAIIESNGHRCFANGYGCFNSTDFVIKECDDPVSSRTYVKHLYVALIFCENVWERYPKIRLFYALKIYICKVIHAPATFFLSLYSWASWVLVIQQVPVVNS